MLYMDENDAAIISEAQKALAEVMAGIDILPADDPKAIERAKVEWVVHVID